MGPPFEVIHPMDCNGDTGGLEGVDDGELLPAKQRGDTVGRFARHILHPLLHVPVKKKTANVLK